jgi:hypothetical protein
MQRPTHRVAVLSEIERPKSFEALDAWLSHGFAGPFGGQQTVAHGEETLPERRAVIELTLQG